MITSIIVLIRGADFEGPLSLAGMGREESPNTCLPGSEYLARSSLGGWGIMLLASTVMDNIIVYRDTKQDSL